jgi:hypothetical protein
MRAQRVREGESRVEMQAAKWTAEGAVNSHYFESAQYSATWGIRQLPGICRYSAKRTVQTVKQGGTAGSLSYARPDRRTSFCRGRAFFRVVYQ